MPFLLYQVGGRLLGIGVIYYCASVLRRAWFERKINYNVSWFFVFDREVTCKRDDSPFVYWLHFAGCAWIMFCGVILAVFGWFHPAS
jgi:hypothetical protein